MSIPNGYGSILTRIFNASGTEVFEGITALSYIHSEKVNDSSRITIETQDVSLTDHPDLQHGKQIKVAFGYASGKIRVHKLWIWDSTPQFGADYIRIEIIAYCKAAYMKLNSRQESYNNAGLDDMLKSMADQYGLNLKDETNKPAAGNLHEYNGQTNSVLNFGERDSVSGQQGSTYVSVARDATATPLKAFLFKKYDSMPQAGRSDAAQVEKFVKQEPTENLVIEGRDDDLIIKKRNLKQKPFKGYVYRGEPGHLLEFNPASQNIIRRRSSTGSSTGGWDEKDLKYFQGAIDGALSTEPLLNDSIEKIQELPGQLDGKSTDTYSIPSEDGKEIFKEKNSEKLDNGKSWDYLQRYGVKDTPDVLDFKSINTKVTHAVDETRMTFPIAFPKEQLPSVETTKKDAVGVALNRQSSEDNSLNESTAKFIGDPELQSGIIITIMNAGKTYSGNYYIVSAEHQFTPEGYTTYCVMFRNGKKKLPDDQTIINGGYIGRVVNKQTTIPDDGTRELNEIPIRKD